MAAGTGRQSGGEVLNDAKHQRLVVDAVVYMTASYLIQPIMFVSNLMVRRNIGPYLAGVVATLTLVASYAAYANLGMLGAAERDLPFYLGAKDQARYRFVRRLTLAVALGSGAVVALGVAGWAIWHRDDLATPLFVGLLVYAPLVMTAQWLAHQTVVLRSTKEFVFLAKLQLGFATATAILNVVATRYAGLYGLLTVTAAAAVLQIVYLSRRLPPVPPVEQSHGPLLKEIWSLVVIGAPILLQGFVATGVRTVDNVLVLRLLGTEALGLYAVAIAPAAIVYSFVNSLTVILFPRMREAHGEHGDVKRLSGYVVPTSITAGAVAPLFIGVLLWLFPVVVRTFLPKFTPAVPAFVVAATGSYFFAMTQISASFLTSLGRQLRIAVCYAVGAAAALAAGIAAHQLGFGMVGIAAGAVFGHFLSFVLMNASAALSFGDRRYVGRFLVDLLIPIAVAAPLSIAVSKVAGPAIGRGGRAFLLAGLCTLVFWALYSPVLIWLDRKTGIRRTLILPFLARVRARLSKSSA